jgi:hypothetical protein
MNLANVPQPRDSGQQQLYFVQQKANRFSTFKATSTQMKKNWEWSEKSLGSAVDKGTAFYKCFLVV